MNEKQKAPQELDNDVMPPEEMMEVLSIWPIAMVIQLCEEIREDSEAGYY